jgi:hypothetical protein
VHHEKVDLDKLSYFEIEGICKKYGYKSGDLMYFKDPRKSLIDGLYLITSYHDVLSLSACHTGMYCWNYTLCLLGMKCVMKRIVKRMMNTEGGLIPMILGGQIS